MFACSMGKRITILLLWWLIFSYANADKLQEGINHFNQNYFDEALASFDQIESSEPDYYRYKALTLYRLRQYSNALDIFEQALATNPDDYDLRLGYAATLVRLGRIKQAEQSISSISRATFDPELFLIKNRILVGKGEVEQAVNNLRKALPDSGNFFDEYARLLTELFIKSGQFEQARQILQNTRENDIGSFYSREAAGMLEQFPLPQKNLDITIGYRFAYDENARLEPESKVVSFDEVSDSYHGLFADLRWRKLFNNGWDLLAESHLSYSHYQDISETNQFWQYYLISPGWTGSHWSFRLPAGYISTHYDGDHFENTYEITPTSIYRINDSLFAYLFYRYRNRDFDLDDERPQENYSGESNSLGLSFFWGIIPEKLNLRVGYEDADFNADGDNWENGEQRFYSTLTYQINSKIKLRGTYEYRDNDYSNLHTIFALKRDDDYNSIGAAISYNTENNYEFEFRILHQQNDSNIDLYTYDRTLYGISISKHF